MAGKSRRIAMLDHGDVTRETITRLDVRQSRVPFVLVITADRAVVSKAVGPELIDKRLDFRNFSWLGGHYDEFQLGDVLRRCRRRMLQSLRKEIELAFTVFQFVLRDQPKVERGDGSEWQTHEAEALIRWLNPDKGLLAPIEFLPEVEAYDMMPRLTEFVLRKAAVQIVKWREQGLGFDNCVNLASSELGRTGLAHNLGMAVCAEGVETQETFESLKTIRCNKMHSFLISEAVLLHIVRRAYSATAARNDEVS